MRRLGIEIWHFAADESGANAIEYGLIAALVAVTALVGITLLGGGVQGLFESINTKVGNAVNNAG